MRRILLAAAIAVLTLVAVFYCEIAGFVLTTVSHRSGAVLSYRTLRFTQGHLVLEGLTASKADTYLLKSELVSIGFHWPCAVTFQIQEPHLTVSKELLREVPSSKEGLISWAAEVDGGVLDWMGGELPTGRFTFKKEEGKTEFTCLFEQGSISFRDGFIEWKKIPFEWVSLLDLPFSDCKGNWNGHFDGKVLHAEGEKISFRANDLSAKGTFSIDWQRPDHYSLFPQRFRLLIDEGEIHTPLTSVKQIKLLSTFQAGDCAMCEGSAQCVDLPLSILGKGFFSSEASGWMTGSLTLGNGKVDLSFKEGAGAVLWEGFSTQEISFLQDLGQSFDSRAKCVQWGSGTVRGELHYQDGIQLVSMDATGLNLNDFHGDAHWSGPKQELLIAGSWEAIPLQLQWLQNGPLQGEFGGCRFSGNLAPRTSGVNIAIDRIEGTLPELIPLQGTLLSGTADVSIDYSRGIEDWTAKCQIAGGALPDWNLSSMELDVLASQSAIEVAASGIYPCKNGLLLHLNAPLLRVSGDKAWFDVRLEDENWDLFRVVGAKQGAQVSIDEMKSHLLGSKLDVKDLLWEEGAVSSGRLSTQLKWPVLALFLEKAGLVIEAPLNDLKVEATLDQKDHLKLVISDGNWNAEAEYNEKRWNVVASSPEGAASFELFEAKDGAFQIKKGMAKYKELVAFGFEGKVFESLSANLTLQNVQVDASVLPIEGIKGRLEGGGWFNVNASGYEADLDMKQTCLGWNDWQFESASPLHLFCSSENGLQIQGMQGRLTQGPLEVRGKVDLIEYNKKRDRWLIRKGSFQASRPNQEIDFTGDFDCSFDLTDIRCHVERGSVLALGQMRQVEDISCSITPHHWKGSGTVLHQDKRAGVTFDISKEEAFSGIVSLREEEQDPLSIRWSYDAKGLTVHSVEGNFAGIGASLRLADTDLVGTVSIDFHQLCEWVPPSVAEGFRDIEMGSGYELKGSLTLNGNDFSKSCFRGILSGKQIELFGFEFRTLMAEAELTPEKIHIRDVRVSDSSVLAKIDEILIQSKEGAPWTIQMPKFHLEDLRPSQLRKPGEEQTKQSPLRVRQFDMEGFQGILDDGNTFRAKGSLSFINTYKREETFFDFPANIFGRIVGIDLDLLVPVKGNLSFVLSDGYFKLTELKDAFSEGDRSEFFLVDTNESPRVDLRGNLQILVKMKQFVLFALTESFVISIDGNLADPHFKLQKKKS